MDNVKSETSADQSSGKNQGEQWELKKLLIAQIRIDGGTQMRDEISEEVVSEYAEALREEACMPPVVAFWDGSNHWLADGFHRFHAATRAGCVEIAAEVHQGNRRDAILHAVGANARHGLRRSNADKRAAIKVLLSDEEWGGRTDKWIADHCHVCNHLVKKIRKESEASQIEADGKLQSGSDASTHDRRNEKGGTRLTRNGKIRPATYNRKKASTSGKTCSAGEPVGSAGNDNLAPGADSIEEPRNGLGQSLTDKNREAFALIPEIKAMGREIDSLIRRASEYREGPAGAYLDINRITAELKNAKRALIQNLPFANCPHCEGNGCRLCRESGYITRILYDQLPEELKDSASLDLSESP